MRNIVLLVSGQKDDLLALVGLGRGRRTFPFRLRAGIALDRRLGVRDCVCVGNGKARNHRGRKRGAELAPNDKSLFERSPFMVFPP